MKKFKKEQLYNDPTYDKRSDELIEKIYQLVSELTELISQGDSSSICLVNGALYLFANGAWEVRNGNNGTKLISSLKDIEEVMGYYFAPADDPEPESYLFRMTPDIKRTQVCQIFYRLLEVTLDEYEVL
jgi:hypothetical protein